MKISDCIHKEKEEMNLDYISELKKCIQDGKSSPKLLKIINILNKSSQQVEQDENAYNLYQENKLKLLENEILSNQIDAEFREALKELQESNKQLNEAGKTNDIIKIKFQDIQNKNDRLLVDKLKLIAELKNLEVWK